tara:strand:- start:2210 stop:2446 length:237 start_codon:yes stop_codon:yes gene_type:complete
MRERPSIVAPKRLLPMGIQFAPQRRTKTTTRAQETIATIALSKTSKSQLLIWLINNKRKYMEIIMYGIIALILSLTLP